MSKASTEYKRSNLHAQLDALSKSKDADGASAELFEILWSIARGERKVRKRVREPEPGEDTISYALVPWIEIVPSIAEQRAAVKDLLEYRIGKPTQRVEVDMNHTVKVFRNLSALSDKELEDMEFLANKIELQEGIATPAPIRADAVDLEPEDAEIVG